MPNAIASPLGVCILPEPRPNAARTVSYPQVTHEILRHAGLCYTEIATGGLADALPGLRLLLTVGDSDLTADLRARLAAWVEGGGRWLAVGGTGGASNLFGIETEAPAYGSFGGGAGTLGEGYLRREQSHPILDHLRIPLHYFNGLPAQATDATRLASALDAHQRLTNRAAITEKSVGQGCCLLIAPDIPGTLVRIQQGTGVNRDGVSAPDGTAPVGDNVLKSSDGGVLDWIFDRQPVPGVPGLQGFFEPIADQWREVLLRGLFYLAEQAGVSLPLLWLYPRNLPGLAHLSHDTDQNEPAKAERLLEVVAQAGIHSTWCVILPGYDAALIERIRAAGHELAMHYDSMSDDCPWSADLFHEQWQRLTAMFGGQEPVTNKNHYLRWEGDCELWQWCVAHGIQLDQSKGASKTGEAGFNFGTCHPYFPVDFPGNTLDVLELPTPTQDFLVFAPPAILDPMLDAVMRSHGILHLLFHPAHIDKPNVAEAILHAVAAAQAQGLEWWTAARINQWERARRQVTWSDYRQDPGGAQVTLHSGAPLEGATALWLGSQGEVSVADGAAAQVSTVTRWGFPFRAVTFDAAAGEPTPLTFQTS